jgi:hypothetical protein
VTEQRRRKKGGRPAGETIGGILAGFDQQVFRTTPPPHELVKQGDRLPSVPSSDGGRLTIGLPGDEGRADDGRREEGPAAPEPDPPEP